MMKMNKYLVLVVFILVCTVTRSQTEGLTSSPYSLYGIGTINQSSIGRSNGMGYVGIGLKTKTEINNLNPANFALIPQNSFFYDVGVTGEFNTFSNKASDESKSTLNFSNLALAFRITEGLGAGLSLTPYSDVGYTLVGLVSNIEGSEESFESNVSGVGGLNDLAFNIGYGITDALRLGIKGSVLFGNIEESESFVLSNSNFELEKTTNYSGFRLGVGMHYDVTDNITLGSEVQFPVTLNANLTRSVYKVLDAVDVVVEDEYTGDASDFKLPLELGFGMSMNIKNSLTLSADFKRNIWDQVEQSDSSESYRNQDIYAFGLEYLQDQEGWKYWQRIRYRAGFNYDNGYLAINDSKIDGYSLTLGLGLPMTRLSNSLINISYAYSQKGQVQNILIQENYHALTINLSLEDLWFRKRKIN